MSAIPANSGPADGGSADQGTADADDRDPAPWRVRDSRITYRDRWITLRSDDCETGRGHRLSPFHVIEWPDWINVVALTAAGEIVLVHEYRHGAGQVVTGLPSGTMEPGEPDSRGTAERELAEETGYQGAVWQKLATLWANPAVQTNRIHSWLAHPVQPTGRIDLDLGEDIRVELRPFAAVIADLRAGRLMVQASHLAAIHAAALLILAQDGPDLADLRAALTGQFGVRADAA